MTAEAVKVIVRCRPMNGREKDLKCKVFFYFFANKMSDVDIIPFFVPLSAMCFHGPKGLTVFHRESQRSSGLTQVIHL